MRLEHFASYSSVSYCTHSSVYRVSSDRVVDCNVLILFRSSTTAPEHLIDPDIQNYTYSMKRLNNFQNDLPSDAHYRTGILHFIESKHIPRT